MSKSSSSQTAIDRNLLFAALALQMEFIESDKLVDALNSWAADKAKPLGEFLVASGSLSTEVRDALNTLVDKQMELQESDTRQLIAAIFSRSDVRIDAAQLTDADVLASLQGPDAEFPQTIPNVAGGEIPSTLLPPPLPGPDKTTLSTQRRFRTLRYHAGGGLGDVYVAQDEDLQREVALKEIKAEAADNEANRARFLLEATITGGLEHPGIVPVYALGAYPDGRPFYAMRFIRGETLQAAIKRFHAADGADRDPGERSLELRKLLDRFVVMCNAMAYAHSRGVLHRDLKPANVMLGPYGETLVVDWGLAKTIGREQSVDEDALADIETTLRPKMASGSGQTHGPIGTPAYMGPEQAAGKLSELTPLSDVYSLGATLYQLLCGDAPVIGTDLPTTLARVQMGRYPAPRAVKSSVPKPLEAVCQKAMSLRPQDRYESARALGEDVERWLADEPVLAWQEPFPVRARRWVQHHRTPVVSAVAALLVATVSLGIGSILLTRAWSDATIARDNAETAERAATQSGEEAKANYAMAVDAVDTYLTKVTESEELQPHVKLKKELLGSALEFYQTQAQDRGDSPEAMARRGRMLGSLGLLYSELDRPQEAIDQLQKSQQIFAELASMPGATQQTQHRLAMAHHNLAHLYETLGNRAQACASYAKAIQLWEALLEKDPNATESRGRLAVAYKDYAWLGPLEESGVDSQTLNRKALALFEELAQAHPGEPDYKNQMAAVLNNVGSLALSDGAVDDAEVALFKARDIQEPLVEMHPDVPIYREFLSTHFWNLGNLYSRTGRPTEALEAYTSSVTHRQYLVDTQPSVPRYLNLLSAALTTLATFHSDRGNVREALRLDERALEIDERLAGNYPELPQYRADESVSHRRMGWAQSSAGNRDSAIEHFSKAEQIARSLVDEYPDNIDHRNLLATTLYEVANFQSNMGHPRKAEELFTESVAMWRESVSAQPENSGFQSSLAVVLKDAAILLDSQGRMDEADKFDEEAVALYEALAAKEQDNREFASQVGAMYHNMGMRDETRGDLEAAISRLERAREIQERLVEADPQTVQYRNFLANHLWKLANLYSTAKRPDEALQAFAGSIQHRRQLSEQVPQNAEYRIDLANTYRQLATYQLQLERLDDAIASLEANITLREQLANDDPSDASHRNTLRFNYTALVGAYELAGRLKDALAIEQKALVIDQRFGDELAPVARPAQLARHHFQIGFLHLQIGNRALADEHFRLGIDTQSGLPQNTAITLEHKYLVAQCHVALGGVHLFFASDPASAVPWFERAKALFEDAAATSPDVPELKAGLAIVYDFLAKCFELQDQPEEATAHYKRALEMLKSVVPEGDPIPDIAVPLASRHASLGNHQRASELLAGVDADQRMTLAAMFDLASAWAACAKAADDDESLEAPQRQELVDQYAAEAMTVLRQFRDKGYFRFVGYATYLQSPLFFESLREREDFKKLLQEVTRQEVLPGTSGPQPKAGDEGRSL